MTKLIAVAGATGNQGGSVARLLLKYPKEYAVRALTRNPQSNTAQELGRLGANVVQADLTVPSTVKAALAGCWGVFAVTDFIKDDPLSEEQQGKNIADAALENNVQCLIWSTMPSSREISKGKIVTQLYEGKHNVDLHIKQIGQPACFFLTGSFCENLVLRKYVKYVSDGKALECRVPVVKSDSPMSVLWVEKDLAATAKAVFDQWDTKKGELYHQEFVVAGERMTFQQVGDLIQYYTGMKCEYVTGESSGVPERDAMLRLYNEVEPYPGRKIPDPKVLKLGVQFHGMAEYIKERLKPALGLA